uniref:Large ribosomal subunit protein mL42 n=2 Tax=Magallana gigas TaxID=29159 RepID=A0A8W8LRG5_MAGGI|nr:39S ribosomal protein L42, mitochondrial isoform X4 [Crassostrea gigas]
MAASMQRVLTFSVFRHIRSNVCSNGMVQRRHKSHDSANDTEDNYTEKNKPSVTLSRDESMVICWHPEPKFPYECSKPMPRETEDTVQGDSPLKLQYIRDFRIRNRPTGPTISELSAIFYDTKHPFYPRPRATRRKVRNLPPPDREGI